MLNEEVNATKARSHKVNFQINSFPNLHIFTSKNIEHGIMNDKCSMFNAQ